MEGKTILDDGSWAIIFSPKDNCIYIRTTDYHADPLKISKSRLTQLAGLFETDSQQSVNTQKPTQSLPKPSDTQEIASQRGWTIGISKKDKLLFCENKGGIAEPLVFSQRELYRYGKLMNKRVKIKK